MLPILISVSLAPVSYFFCASAAVAIVAIARPSRVVAIRRRVSRGISQNALFFRAQGIGAAASCWGVPGRYLAHDPPKCKRFGWPIGFSDRAIAEGSQKGPRDGFARGPDAAVGFGDLANRRRRPREFRRSVPRSRP